MTTDEIRAAIVKRAATEDEWAYGVKQCWEEEIAILFRNIDDTIAFLESECTADEVAWLSEVIDDVAEKTQSRAFVDCLYKVAKKYPETCKEYYIDRVLAYCEGALNEA